FPAVFLAGDQRLLGLCSGSFYVEHEARTLGYYLFKKHLRSPGYSFFFATTCNASSGALWEKLGGCALPDSETEYILPLRLDTTLSEFVSRRHSSVAISETARLLGACANPILRLLVSRPARLAIEPCQDWQKLSELFRRCRPDNLITSERSAEYLEWRYGPTAPYSSD